TQQVAPDGYPASLRVQTDRCQIRRINKGRPMRALDERPHGQLTQRSGLRKKVRNSQVMKCCHDPSLRRSAADPQRQKIDCPLQLKGPSLVLNVYKVYVELLD